MLQIFELDSNKEPVSVLKNGEHTFGRGPLLKCDDRRVSRKHGVITVTDQSITITSTHPNPCFYQAANSSTITILPKNNPIDVNDGDKFALLADQFWFRIKLTKDDGDDSITAIATSSISNVSPGSVRNGSIAALSYISAPVSSTTVLDDSITLQITQIAKPEGISEPCKDTNNIDADGSSDSIDLLQPATQKRPHEIDVESPSTKKAKLNNEKDVKNDFLAVLKDLGMQNCEEEDNGDEGNKGNKDVKELMSESDEEDNIHVKVKPDTPKKNPYKWKKPEASTSAQSTRDLELKAMLFSSDEEENENQPIHPKNEAKMASSTENINKDVPLDVKDDSMGTNDDPKDNNSEKDEDPNIPSTSTSNTKKPRRDHCWYALNCYRKNAAHLAEYSHPGDSDFGSDPEDDRPMCAFGAACYRRNKDHRQEYKHSSKPQKPPAGGKKQKKKTKKADTLQKRTTRKKYNESSEDDYDLEDPFLDDSGTEYEVTSSDNDSDSESSGASEDGTKRLLKEAKKFTRGKKKDDAGD